jgi:protein gp37
VREQQEGQRQTQEQRQEADRRIPHLLAVPARVRFLSCEPLLGPVDLFDIAWPADRPKFPQTDDISDGRSALHMIEATKIDWIIAGGESGPGARASHPDWFRSLRDQCAATGAPFFFKQWGEWGPADPTDEAAPFPNGWLARRGGPKLPMREELYPEAGAAFVAHIGKKAAGAQLDGREHRQFPTS